MHLVLMEEVAMDLGVSDMVAECWLYCVVLQFSMERLMAMVVLEELTMVVISNILAIEGSGMNKVNRLTSKH